MKLNENKEQPTVFSNIHFYKEYEIRQSSKSGRYFIYKDDVNLQGDDGYGDPYRSLEDAKTQIEHSEKRHHPIMATNWETYLMEAIKTGLTSPTPYKVIPYKNGIGIKKIELL
jgi:predicted adenine nucleotide alpha hydrolase (AANH) superfamily ATPase